MFKTLASGILISAVAVSSLAVTGSRVVAETAEPAKLADTSKGLAWVDHKGMTLYMFDKDETGKSNCINLCSIGWHPLSVQIGAEPNGEWTIIVRADGIEQWAFDGKPLYTWFKDKQPGDVTGEGINDFHVAR